MSPPLESMIPEGTLDDLASIREFTEGLYNDVGFEIVGRWKAARKAQGHAAHAIGYLPVYVPRELIHAAGMLPVGVVGHGDLEIIRGDAYFQSYICHLPRSVIEMGVSGKLDHLDGMLFPSTCDVIRNLSGMWKILFPDKLARYVDVPQNFDLKVGGTFYAHELSAIRREFDALTGEPMSDEALRASIAVFNENRRLIGAMYRARAERPWLYSAPDVYLVLRAGHLLPVEDHNRLLGAYVDLAAVADTQPLDNIRVVVSGAFCEQPPLGLIRTLERAGCYVVDDDFLQGYRWIEGAIPETGDPVVALSTAFLGQSNAAASLYNATGENGRALVEAVQRSQADGVVFAAPSFCDPALLDQPMNVAALDRADIPYTSFKYAENTGQFQVIREQAGTFADSIRLWGEA